MGTDFHMRLNEQQVEAHHVAPMMHLEEETVALSQGTTMMTGADVCEYFVLFFLLHFGLLLWRTLTSCCF